MPSLTLDGTDPEAVAVAFAWAANLPPRALAQLRASALYEGYLVRQQTDISWFRREEAVKLPATLSYRNIGGLSNEMCERLTQAMPPTLGAASRVAGITPAALAAILSFVRKGSPAESFT